MRPTIWVSVSECTITSYPIQTHPSVCNLSCRSRFCLRFSESFMGRLAAWWGMRSHDSNSLQETADWHTSNSPTEETRNNHWAECKCYCLTSQLPVCRRGQLGAPLSVCAGGRKEHIGRICLLEAFVVSQCDSFRPRNFLDGQSLVWLDWVNWMFWYNFENRELGELGELGEMCELCVNWGKWLNWHCCFVHDSNEI